MKPEVNLYTQFMAPKLLEQSMLRDISVVPPDSVIKTFSHLRGDKVDLVLTQDGEGLCQGSFILRQTDWAKFFLDTWFDPLYRSYNFQKAEAHALVSFFYPSKDIHDGLNPNFWIGTCCAMASYNPRKIGINTAETAQLI